MCQFTLTGVPVIYGVPLPAVQDASERTLSPKGK